jgi:peptide chain release factor subunit 1
MAAMITEDAIRELAGFRGERAPVTSCYLDVDGRKFRRHNDYEAELQRLLRRARWKVNGTASVADDFRRIEEFVRSGIDRHTVRGVAVFSCTAHDFFETVTLPVPVRSQLVINPVPAVRQLEEVVREYERFGVLLADRQRARLFVFELGQLVDHSELLDELPRDYDQRGERERGDTQHHVEALAAAHLRRAAEAAWLVYRDVGFEHLAIGAPDAIAGQLESTLHPYLRERLVARIPAGVGASPDAIRRAAASVEEAVERRREGRLVDQLRDAVGQGGRAVAGLDHVLDALADRRLERMLVSHGFSESGWQCGGCGRLASVGRHCPRCREEMRVIDDVVEEAVEDALAQSCRIDVCVNNADLDCVGRIGAFLRY